MPKSWDFHIDTNTHIYPDQKMIEIRSKFEIIYMHFSQKCVRIWSKISICMYRSRLESLCDMKSHLKCVSEELNGIECHYWWQSIRFGMYSLTVRHVMCVGTLSINIVWMGVVVEQYALNGPSILNRFKWILMQNAPTRKFRQLFILANWIADNDGGIGCINQVNFFLL